MGGVHVRRVKKRVKKGQKRSIQSKMVNLVKTRQKTIKKNPGKNVF